MKKSILNLSIIAGLIVTGVCLQGCSGNDSSNAEDVKKMEQNKMDSQNPNVPTIDAKNDEFGKGGGDGPKKGGGQ